MSLQQVLHALGNALALGVDGLLLGFGVEDQEVAGRAGVDPLLHRKVDAGPGLGSASTASAMAISVRALSR
jgi:hypothetical protein